MILSSGDVIHINFFFQTKKIMNIIRVANSLEPGQARRIVGTDLSPNCLQRISADDSSRLRVKDKNLINCVQMAVLQYI